MRILFLQLPCLDNESRGERENLHLAGFYLHHSLKRRGSASDVDALFLSPEEECLDDAHLIRLIQDLQPDILCATLYLWNIERTLHLLETMRSALPHAKIIVGGPEVSLHHPFLFRSLVPDIAVVGEGEAAFPLILAALRGGGKTDLSHVAWKEGRSYRWGRRTIPAISLRGWLPHPQDTRWRPDSNGTAYLETGRGCPMRCTYCRYSHLRRGATFAAPEEIIARAQRLIVRGAREIRFVDPTLNAHPAFGTILESLGMLHRKSGVTFFAEVRAERLKPSDISLLAEAGFSEVEVGVQSRDPLVLRLIQRPQDPERLEGNLLRMIENGIQVTVDLMYGLPTQKREEVMDSLRWAQALRPASIQCLQTLLLPGTRLRQEKRRWGISADPLPPYGVHSTKTLSWDEIGEIEQAVHHNSPGDCMTRRFVGARLPDLFPERIPIRTGAMPHGSLLPGRSSRRALIFTDPDPFAQRRMILETVDRAIQAEPHMLWQFVLRPEGEFPLDLLDRMIARIRKYPTHRVDRSASVAYWRRVASRRVFVLLRPGRRYAPYWSEAAEALLEDHFF